MSLRNPPDLQLFRKLDHFAFPMALNCLRTMLLTTMFIFYSWEPPYEKTAECAMINGIKNQSILALQRLFTAPAACGCVPVVPAKQFPSRLSTHFTLCLCCLSTAWSAACRTACGDVCVHGRDTSSVTSPQWSSSLSQGRGLCLRPPGFPPGT